MAGAEPHRATRYTPRMWLLSTAIAGVPDICAPPSVLPFLEEHAAVGDYLRPGNHPLSVEQVVRDGDTLLLWVHCTALMGETSQIVAWKTGDAPMASVNLGYRGVGLDRWFTSVELSRTTVGWPEGTAVQVRGAFGSTSDAGVLTSGSMEVWVVGYPEPSERRRFGEVAQGPRHGEGCPERRVPDGRQTEVWMARAGHHRGSDEAERTVVTSHRWVDGVLEVEERWTRAEGGAELVRRSLSWAYGGLHEVCRIEP